MKGGNLLYLSRSFTLVAPTITNVKDSIETEVITSAGLGEPVVINGKYFGEKPPQVWIEYSVAGKPGKKQLRSCDLSI